MTEDPLRSASLRNLRASSLRGLERLAFLLVAVLLALAGLAIEAGDAAAATLTGTVSWSKPVPPKALPIARDRHVCGVEGPIFDREVAVDSRGRVAEVIVFVATMPKDDKVAPREVKFDQKNCVYVPHVAAATVGSIVRLTSSDPVLHNVHIKDAAGKTVANYAMPVMGQEASLRISVAGPLELHCEAGHDWMRASLYVFEHAFFTMTRAGGRYDLSSVPAGKHTLVAWHPDLGKVEKIVEVPDTKGEVAVDFAF